MVILCSSLLFRISLCSCIFQQEIRRTIRQFKVFVILYIYWVSLDYVVKCYIEYTIDTYRLNETKCASLIKSQILYAICFTKNFTLQNPPYFDCSSKLNKTFDNNLRLKQVFRIFWSIHMIRFVFWKSIEVAQANNKYNKKTLSCILQSTIEH